VSSTNLTDTASFMENGELVKLLTPPMQAKIASLGEPFGYQATIDHDEAEVEINFFGNCNRRTTSTNHGPT
jgi:hypothetical protein